MKAIWTDLPGGIKPHGFGRTKKKVVRLKARTPIKRVTRPKPMSDKRRRESQEYRRKVRKFLREEPTCQAPRCLARSRDVHHSRGRDGSLYLDERFWLALCREHHDLCKTSPQEARGLGILCPPGKWGKSEPKTGEER